MQLAVFDLAGTTLRDDDAVNRCLRETLELVDVRVTRDEVNSVMGLPKPEALRILISRSRASSPLLDRIDEIHEKFMERMKSFYRTDRAVGEIPGAGDLFGRLQRAGIKVAVNTGFGRSLLDAALARTAWIERGLVDATVASDEVPRGRPHPEMIRHLMAKLGLIDPKQVAKIGDTPSDLQEGAEAGCGLVVGVTWGTHRREELARHPGARLVDSLSELSRLFGV